MTQFAGLHLNGVCKCILLWYLQGRKGLQKKIKVAILNFN